MRNLCLEVRNLKEILLLSFERTALHYRICNKKVIFGQRAIIYAIYIFSDRSFSRFNHKLRKTCMLYSGKVFVISFIDFSLELLEMNYFCIGRKVPNFVLTPVFSSNKNLIHLLCS